MGQKRSGFTLSKKHDKYVTEIDHPVAQKTVNYQKHRNPKGHSKDPENQLTSPKDVRCSRDLGYFMKDQVIEKSNDILEECVEKGMSSLIITDCGEKNQPRRPTCPPGFSDLPPLLSYNVEKGMSSLIVTDTEQDQEKNLRGRPTCPSEFSDIPQALINNIDCHRDKARNSIEVVSEAEDQAKITAIVEGLQDIIHNWRGEYAMGSVGQYSWF